MDSDIKIIYDNLTNIISKTKIITVAYSAKL